MSLAFVFPGQGSQSVGMLADLGERKVVQDTFAAASGVLGYDLWEVVQHGPRERLDVTECTQPAMLTAGVALWRLWQEAGGAQPAVLAGHSLGEYSALVCAGALDFEAGVGLVQQRGRYMQEAVPAGTGAMAAVLGLDDEGVEAACDESSKDTARVEPVNYNAPGQVVIAGHAAAVESAIEAVRARGARRAILLPVSVPSHSSLMLPAAKQLADRLAEVDFQEPGIPVYTVGLRRHGGPDDIRSALVEQVHSPVRWADTIRCMASEAGVQTVVECGPGKVLSGLLRRIDRRIAGHAIFDADSLAAVAAELGESS